jgi:molybdopterin-guanine dinucleotide biosynthesis protein A
MTPYAAVVLAGGRSRRMGGGDKTRLPVGDRPLLDRVLGALDAAAAVVVVGDERPAVRPVTWTTEEPARQGPAAAVGAALVHVERAVTVLLAGDLPFLTSEFVGRLVADVSAESGVVPLDAEDMPQWLCSAWPTDLLRSVDWSGARSLRDSLGALPFRTLRVDSGATPPWLDCDTPEDLRRARELS